MNQQQRIELQESVMQIIDNFMAQNNVRASDMEDALNKVIIQLKDAIMRDFLQEAYANAQQITVEETEEKEE